MDDYSFIALFTMNFIKQLSEDKIDLKKARYFRTRIHHYCAMNLIKQFSEDKSDLQKARYLQTRKQSEQKKLNYVYEILLEMFLDNVSFDAEMY